MRNSFKVPPAAMVPLVDVNNCPTGEWAVNVVIADTAGLTLVPEKDSPIVKFVDASGCVKVWAVRLVGA